MKAVSRALILVSLLLFTRGVLSAQCPPQPDQLDGPPCCSLANAHIPAFPPFQQNAFEICWQNCNVSQVLVSKGQWTNVNILPNPGTTGGTCSYRLAKFTLLTPGNAVKWSGQVRLLYSRTWIENPVPGTTIQVWRFLANGDLTPTTVAGPVPCPVPPCAAANGNKVRYTGYVDYAFDCGTNAFQFAWMLTHACDFFDHGPGFPRSGVFHPDRSYTIVGPALGFVPAALQPIEGGATAFESLRRLRYPPAPATAPIFCEAEERAFHNLNPLGQFCQCGTSLTAQFNQANLLMNGSCGTQVVTTGVPFIPGFFSMGIGAWTTPGVYPGQENLRWNAGGYDDFDPCTGVNIPGMYYGVTTLNGDPAFQLNTSTPSLPLPLTFVDQANSIRAGGGPVRNTPFLSDLILNMNH